MTRAFGIVPARAFGIVLSRAIGIVLSRAFGIVLSRTFGIVLTLCLAHAAAILEFMDRWPQAERLVVHCHVGASRSPGVALGLCDRFGWPVTALEHGYPMWNRWVRQVLVSHP